MTPSLPPPKCSAPYFPHQSPIAHLTPESRTDSSPPAWPIGKEAGLDSASGPRVGERAREGAPPMSGTTAVSREAIGSGTKMGKG